MFKDISINLAASVIYDFSKAILGKAGQQEAVQATLKKLGYAPHLHDFPERYMEALVKLRLLGKEKAVMDFFREESIMAIFYNYYYGAKTVRGKEAQVQQELRYWTNALAVGDTANAANINIPAEANYFWAIFQQKVQESRTVKEAEIEQQLQHIKNQTGDITTSVEQLFAWLKTNQKEQVHIAGKVYQLEGQGLKEQIYKQFAEKIFNIKNIEQAHFYIKGKTVLPKYLGNPPFFPEVFLGRENDIAEVHQQLFKGENLLLLVNGKGGIGKTTLAAVYYQQFAHQYTHLAWVFAEKSILESLLTLAIPLKIQFGPKEPNASRLNKVLERMRALEKPCLLVLDNANELDDLKKYYKTLRSCPNFHLLLTTRITQFQQARSHVILPLTDANAKALFTTYYPQHQNKDDTLLMAIFEAVGKNTLVIELLAKNLANLNQLGHYSLSNLLKDIQTKGLLGIRNKSVGTYYQAGDEIREAMPEAIIAAMYDLGNLPSAEKRLMSIFAVLPAENIAFSMLQSLLPNTDNLDDTLLSLAQKGWLDFDREQKTFKVSPIIQEVTKEKNDRLLKDCEELFYSLTEFLSFEPNTGHLEKISYHQAIQLVYYAENIVKTTKNKNNSLAMICERIGKYFETTGDLLSAEFYFKEYLQLKKLFYQENAQNTYYKESLAKAYSRLGSIHASLGNLKMALSFFQERLKLGKELYESFPQNVSFKYGLAISYEKLGSTHSSLGNLKIALFFFEDYSQLTKELYNSFPQNVSFKNGLAISFEKLGDTHSNLGNLQKALKFFQDQITLSKELYNRFPQNVSFKNELAISYSRLGSAHSSLGNLKMALFFFEDYRKLRKELYDNFPQNVRFKQGLAISYEKLGSTHSSLGNLKMALSFFEDYHKLIKKLYDRFPQNVSIKNSLAISYYKVAQLYEKKEDYEKAFEYYQLDLKFTDETYLSSPTNALFKEYLLFSYNKMIAISNKLGKKDLVDFYTQKVSDFKENN